VQQYMVLVGLEVAPLADRCGARGAAIFTTFHM